MPASEHSLVQKALAEAAERTAKYEWMDAVALYRKALDAHAGAMSTIEFAQLTELVAKCYFKGAFQSENREELKRRMRLAEATYETAANLYESAGSEARSKRLKSRASFSSFWLKDNPADRRTIIAECISAAEEAAKIFESQSDKTGLAEVHGDTLAYLLEAWALAKESTVLKDVFGKAFRIRDKLAEVLGATPESESLIESLSNAIAFLVYSYLVVGPAKYQELRKKAEDLAARTVAISERIGTPYALSIASTLAAGKAALESDYVKALDLLESALSAAQLTRDSSIIGDLAAQGLTYTRNAMQREEDMERRLGLLERGIQLLPIALKNGEILSHGGILAGSLEMSSDCYTDLARFIETEPDKKKTCLEHATELARRAYAYRDYASHAGHGLGKTLYFLAMTEMSSDEKARLLAEALPIREETVREADLLYPGSVHQAVTYNYLALIKAELSTLAQDPKVKVELLQSAVSNMKTCVELCAKWTPAVFNPASLTWYEEWYGDILFQLHRQTNEPDTGRSAIKAYEDAIEYLTLAKLTGPVADVRWKIARVHDTLGDHKQASRVFRKAAEDYRHGAEKIRGSATMFGELASYMESWSLIEEARIHHGEEQYLRAAECYTTAAKTLQPTRTWGYLSKHYMACSYLEGGEALSRQERQEASIESFSEAVKAFGSARTDIDLRSKENLGSQEKQELATWRSITDRRERLCQGRILLEKARILHRNGEDEASSAKYLSAGEIFKELMEKAEIEQARRELEALVLFCDAWGKTKQAEARASPELYAEAADSFTRLERIVTGKRSRLMALASAAICKAMESGTVFRRTRNTRLYSDIKKHLETATDYHQQAGLQDSADWTRATGNLFDALAYLTDAATERDSRKKTEFYHLAEKHLQLAARLYDEAGFPSRKEEALKHLERARQEKEVLLTPMEVLAANPALQGTPVAPVSLLRDQPVGLERLEASNVVGNLSLTHSEVGVGSDMILELEIANVGRTAATLIKLENMAPEGLELDRQATTHKVVDNFIDMKGKRLEYLKTLEVKVSMKALRKGSFELRPRILYLDEKGNYRSYEFEPAALRVRELGISGWIRGSSK